MQGSTTTLWPSLVHSQPEKVDFMKLIVDLMLNDGAGTLLNRLFGTTFDVMDETQRRQTTKGELWTMTRIRATSLNR